MLWSLIAQLTKSDDLRVKHLRSLWIRQVRILDSEGGLALTAFKIRITYVNIIQVSSFNYSNMFALLNYPFTHINL